LAELPVEALLARADELAKQWVIALILARPLAEIGEIPLEDLAQDAPILLAQTIRALSSNLELDRLTAAPPLRGRDQAGPAWVLAAISGATDATAVVQSVEALRSVLWQGLLAEQRWQVPESGALRQLSDLSERLASVCASMLAVALEQGKPESARLISSEASAATASVGGASRHRATSGGALIVDERAEPAPTRPPAEPAVSAEHLLERPLSWDESPPRPPRSAGEPEAPFAWDQSPVGASDRGEIAIRDARGEEGPTAWIGLISSQLELAEEDGRPFAVLLVEPREIEHPGAGEPHSEMLRLSEELEDALAVAFGAAPQGEQAERPLGRGSLTRERPTRYWLLAPATDRVGATSLAERLRRAVASVVEYRGEPLEVVIGTAICPEDGSTPAALAAHADVSLYAARSVARAARGPRTALRED
jgi:hypothetical protein